MSRGIPARRSLLYAETISSLGDGGGNLCCERCTACARTFCLTRPAPDRKNT